jgi:LysM repeat protein
MIRGRAFDALIALLLLLVIIDVGVASWLLTPALTRVYVVQPGETMADVAARFRVHPQVVAEANGLSPGIPVQSGQMLRIPMAPLGPFLDGQLQLAGLAATLLGGLTALWLCAANSIMPAPSGGLGIAIPLTVAIVHYIMAQATTIALPEAITPAFVLASVADGFAWTCVVPLLSGALGHRGQEG